MPLAPEFAAILVSMVPTALERIRQIALVLPDLTERLSAGAPCFFVSKSKPICRFHDSKFSEEDRVSIWCPAPLSVRDELVTSEPDGFFAPTPSASGVFADWIGVYLDTTGELAVGCVIDSLGSHTRIGTRRPANRL